MKKLFSAADRYLRICDWRDLALLKSCLSAMGVLMGLLVPTRNKKTVAKIAGLLFMVTYIPLMVKFLLVACSNEDDE